MHPTGVPIELCTPTFGITLAPKSICPQALTLLYRVLQPDLTELEKVVRRVRELAALTPDQQSQVRPSDKAILAEVVEDSFIERFVTLSDSICETARYLTNKEPNASMFKKFDIDENDDTDDAFISLQNWLRQAKTYLGRLVAMEDRKEAEVIRPTSTVFTGPVGFVSYGNMMADSIIGIKGNATALRENKDTEDVGKALDALTEAVKGEQSLSDAKRLEALQQVNFLGQQAATPIEKRQVGLIKPIIDTLSGICAGVGGLAAAWDTWGTVIAKFFGF